MTTSNAAASFNAISPDGKPAGAANENAASAADNKAPPFIRISTAQDGSTDIIVSNLTLTRPDDGTPLIQDVNLIIHRGDRLVLTGPSGSGKSSLIKAMTNLWESGQGNVILPADAQISCVSQKAYMPNTSLKGILAYPRSENDFSSDAVEDALRAVGHDRLVQYLPGQQVGHILDALLEKITEYAQEGIPSAEWTDRITPLLPELIKARIDVIQYVLPVQEVYLKQKLTADAGLPDGDAENIGAALIQRLNEGLAQRFLDDLAADIPQLAEECAGDKKQLAPGEIEYLSELLHRNLGRKLSRLVEIRNDPQAAHGRISRLYHSASQYVSGLVKGTPSSDEKGNNAPLSAWQLQINKQQADYIADQLTKRLRAELSSPPQGMLSALFNKASFALHWHALKRNADQATSYFLTKIAAGLNRQIVNGDTLSKRLSGGEQQRLIFARILLHAPNTLILDEITSALDRKAGDELYQLVLDKLPGATIISVAHQPNVIPFHTHHGQITEDKRLSVTRVEQAIPSPSPAPRP